MCITRVNQAGAIMIAKLIIKRIMDLLVAVICLLLLSPLFAIISLLVLCDLGSPIFFAQQRTGRLGKPFRIYKFRTMKNTSQDGHLLPDSERITSLGRMLRSYSLDELPEFLNVLTGHISIVGPRPLLPQYMDLYTPEQARRHEVKPGITGWAQVNGRNALTWEEKFKLDVWYVDNWNFWLDVKILFMTIVPVLKRDGISNDGHVTMPEFKGTKETSRMDPPC